MDFEIWHYWLISSILFMILEMVIPSFVVFNFGIGSIFGCIAAALSLSLEWQLAFFSLATLCSFFLIRPVVKRWAYRKSHRVETNADALVGRTGLVSETINPLEGTGRVKLDGDDWKARSKNDEVLSVNTQVRIIRVDSIVLEVEKSISSK